MFVGLPQLTLLAVTVVQPANGEMVAVVSAMRRSLPDLVIVTVFVSPAPAVEVGGVPRTPAVPAPLVSVIPSVHLAYMSPAGHVAIETAAGLIGLLVAYIVLGRFLRTGEPRDLALTAALTTLGFTNLLFASIPLAASSGIHRFSTWAPVAGRLLGAFLFAVSAFIRGRLLTRPREAVLPVMLACAAGL